MDEYFPSHNYGGPGLADEVGAAPACLWVGSCAQPDLVCWVVHRLVVDAGGLSPAIARVEHMFDDVVAVRDRLAVLVDRLDPDVFSGSAARELWQVFDAAERLSAAGKTLLARRLAETHRPGAVWYPFGGGGVGP